MKQIQATRAARLLGIVTVIALAVTACAGEPKSGVGSDDPVPSPKAPLYDGYGDFSGIGYFDIDWYDVTAREVQCANDNGIPVRLIPPGDGFSFASVPPEQSAAAMEVIQACQEALKLPDYQPPGRAELEEVYAYKVALAGCLESHGYQTSDPPSVDVFVDSQGSWNPYSAVPHDDVDELDRLQQLCPQQPIGGYGTWNPGDPITPAS